MILCAGEALIDMLPRKTEAGEDAFAPYPGGAVLNTAIALGRLGAPAGFFYGLSTDFFGDMLRAHLAESGVEDRSHSSMRPTTLAFVKLVDGQATYAFYDEETAGRMLSPADLPEESPDALFIGGISLVGEPVGTAIEALAGRESERAAIVIDPNIRPGFITDETGYRDRIERLLGVADVVKLSDEDLRWLMGDGELSDLARRVCAMGPALVCITEGAEGVTGYAGDRAIRVAARKVTVADTVGAGDTFNAGLMASLHEAGVLTKAHVRDLSNEVIRDALDLGVRAAAVTVSRAGANPPRRDEL